MSVVTLVSMLDTEETGLKSAFILSESHNIPTSLSVGRLDARLELTGRQPGEHLPLALADVGMAAVEKLRLPLVSVHDVVERVHLRNVLQLSARLNVFLVCSVHHQYTANGALDA